MSQHQESYLVLTAFNHDGQTVNPKDEIKLFPKQAVYLITSGKLKLKKSRKKSTKKEKK